MGWVLLSRMLLTAHQRFWGSGSPLGPRSKHIYKTHRGPDVGVGQVEFAAQDKICPLAA